MVVDVSCHLRCGCTIESTAQGKHVNVAVAVGVEQEVSVFVDVGLQEAHVAALV